MKKVRLEVLFLITVVVGAVQMGMFLFPVKRSVGGECPNLIESMGNKARDGLYEAMSADISTRGCAEFTKRYDPVANAVVLEPHLHHLNEPVHAVVLPVLNDAVARRISSNINAIVKGAYLQDSHLYHVSMYHLRNSSRKTLGIVGGVVGKTCPLHISLERVVVTKTGVVLGCWQVASKRSLEPSGFRAGLGEALKETEEHSMPPDLLHTTLARLPCPHRHTLSNHEIAHYLTQRLCGIELLLSTAWVVDEHDYQALAYHGRYTKENFPFKCPKRMEG